jgi:hypothetical protein
MKSEPEDINELVEALRADLPTERDAARIRARLAGFGVALGTGLTASEGLASLAGAKAVTGAGTAGLWSQFGALSLGAKLGVVAAVSVSAVTGPLIVAKMESKSAPALVVSAARTTPERTPSVTSKPAPASAVVPEAAATGTALIAPPPDALPEKAPVLPRATTTANELPAVARVPVSRVEPTRARPLAEAAIPAGANAAPVEPATAPALAEAPPALTAPATATTLGEETGLIDAAFSALRAGDRGTAESFVREHERRFPNGMLRRERERARAALLERR